jgi:hypothetical protein
LSLSIGYSPQVPKFAPKTRRKQPATALRRLVVRPPGRLRPALRFFRPLSLRLGAFQLLPRFGGARSLHSVIEMTSFGTSGSVAPGAMGRLWSRFCRSLARVRDTRGAAVASSSCRSARPSQETSAQPEFPPEERLGYGVDQQICSTIRRNGARSGSRCPIGDASRRPGRDVRTASSGARLFGRESFNVGTSAWRSRQRQLRAGHVRPGRGREACVGRPATRLGPRRT